jgi:hypothetical protein
MLRKLKKFTLIIELPIFQGSNNWKQYWSLASPKSGISLPQVFLIGMFGSNGG